MTVPQHAGALALPDDFGVSGTWLDSASSHPMPRKAAAAVRDFLHLRMADGLSSMEDTYAIQALVKEYFAQLVNCEIDDLAFIPSTSAGENMVLAGLGIRDSGRVVTDRLHYNGSLYLYERLRQRGVDVVVIEPRNHAIDLDDIRRVLGRPTNLVAVSHVSAYNGFAHNLAALSDICHEAGALLYVDIVQGVGAVPIDVKAVKIDFCASSSYKWLMGDFGVGFLYAEREALAAIKASQFGARQLVDRRCYTLDSTRRERDIRDGAAGIFEVGTIATAAVAALSYSLPFILKLGTRAIASHRRPLIERLSNGIAELGLVSLTPVGTDTQIFSFAWSDSQRLRDALLKASIYVTIHEDRVRVSPSVFNTLDDIERFLGTLKLVL